MTLERTTRVPHPHETPAEEIAALQQEIRDRYGCDSVWVKSVGIADAPEGLVRIVELFALRGSARPRLFYAWSEPILGETRRNYFVFPHQGQVDSAEEAVRASRNADPEDEEPPVGLLADRAS